jgi:SAM-dependent methyltransferase
MPNPAVLLAALAVAISALAAQNAKSPTAEPDKAEAPSVTERMKMGAAALAPTVTSDMAKSFLRATAKLSDPGTRTVYRNREKGVAVSARAHDAMSAEQREGFAARECTPDFYFETGYGSPLVYVRALDLAAPHLPSAQPGAKPKLLDFGYGSIGHLQLLAHCGFDAYGVDVEPLFPALYSEPGDTGSIGTGSVSIHKGQWPAEQPLREAIGGGFSLITSKNTLKNGYIHPAPAQGQTVDPKRLIQLGVSDESYVKHVHDTLRPGGIFVIYNICPPQNPPDKEYLPWADGASPFPRELLEKAGFEVIAFDVSDQEWVIGCFDTLGYGEGKPRAELATEYFCQYTIARRKP